MSCTLLELEGLSEAQRCLKCNMPPCSEAVGIFELDTRLFNLCVQADNFYGAARVALSSNPLAYSCSSFIPAINEKCVLSKVKAGPIDLKSLLELALRSFKKMKIPAKVDPALVGCPYAKDPVAVAGGGVAGLSFALFLARLGFENITIFDPAEELGGKLNEKCSEDAKAFEKQMIFKDYGISHVKKTLGVDIFVKTLLEEHKFKYVFVSFGKSTKNCEEKANEKYAVLNISDGGHIVVDSSRKTNLDGVYAGGAVLRDSCSLSDAIHDGKLAALDIYRNAAKAAGSENILRHMPPFFTPVDEVDLSVQYRNLNFKNPFGLSSAPPTTSMEMIKRAFKRGWGFAVIKSVLDEPSTNISPRIVRTDDRRGIQSHQHGYLNIELGSEKNAEYWKNAVKSLKADYPDCMVIASFLIPHDKALWQKMSKDFEEAGADALELNLSCPHIDDLDMGVALGRDIKYVSDITGWVAETSKIPIFTKLTPNVSDISEMAQAAVDNKADGIAAINTVLGLMDIDMDGDPWPGVGEEKLSAFGGLSGEIVRPIALKAVSSIRSRLPETFIHGIGGISSSKSALQHIRAGADVLQVCSAVQSYGYDVVEEMTTGLQWVLYRESRPDLRAWKSQSAPCCGTTAELSSESDRPIPKLKDIAGITAKKILGVDDLDRAQQKVAFLEHPDRCVNCGRCAITCMDSGYQAISFSKKDRVPKFSKKCTGCSLCLDICPTGAIGMKYKDYDHAVFRGPGKKDIQVIKQKFEKN